MIKNKSIYWDSFAIEIFIGEKRSGKTLSMVAKTYEDIKNVKDIKIYSNLKLNRKYFPNYISIKKDDISRFYKEKRTFKKAIFLIDEMHIFFNALDFNKGENNKSMGYFCGQIGKRKNIIRGTTHFLRLVDYRIRLYLERKIACYKGLVNEKGEFEQLINYNEELTKEQNKKLYIRNEPLIHKLINVQLGMIDIKENDFFVKAQDYFGLYDTEEYIFDE